MAKHKSLDEWGRSAARGRYAEGGGTPHKTWWITDKNGKIYPADTSVGNPMGDNKAWRKHDNADRMDQVLRGMKSKLPRLPGEQD